MIIGNINSNLPNFSANFQYGNSSILPKHLKRVADNFEKETSFYPHCTLKYDTHKYKEFFFSLTDNTTNKTVSSKFLKPQNFLRNRYKSLSRGEQIKEKIKTSDELILIFENLIEKLKYN